MKIGDDNSARGLWRGGQIAQSALAPRRSAARKPVPSERNSNRHLPIRIRLISFAINASVISNRHDSGTPSEREISEISRRSRTQIRERLDDGERMAGVLPQRGERVPRVRVRMRHEPLRPAADGSKMATYTSTSVRMIMMMLEPQAMMLKRQLFTCSPIRSRRLISSKMKISTTGSQTPLATCEKNQDLPERRAAESG